MDPKTTEQPRGLTALFLAFLRLGCMAFGGPVAHLGYFRDEFVQRRRWLDDARFGELLALCQFLPGPSSSQLGFAIGMEQRGIRGGCMAWLGFTLPSALLMVACGYGILHLTPGAQPVLSGFLVAAVAVVANAIAGLAPRLCPDAPRILIALFTASLVLLIPGGAIQLGAILIGGLLGAWLFREADGAAPAPDPQRPASPGPAIGALLLFAFLLTATLFIGDSLPAAHYRAGALVFGGGHVVLPLLHEGVVGGGFVGDSVFLAGYGAAQALPGPLFTFAAYLGTAGSTHPLPWIDGLLALLAIFLPGILLLVGVLPFWTQVRSAPRMRAGLSGANAAVVGLLLAAFITPVWTRGIHGPAGLALAALAFAGLYTKRAPAWLVVLVCGAGGFFLETM